MSVRPVCGALILVGSIAAMLSPLSHAQATGRTYPHRSPPRPLPVTPHRMQIRTRTNIAIGVIGADRIRTMAAAVFAPELGRDRPSLPSSGSADELCNDRTRTTSRERDPRSSVPGLAGKGAQSARNRRHLARHLRDPLPGLANGRRERTNRRFSPIDHAPAPFDRTRDRIEPCFSNLTLGSPRRALDRAKRPRPSSNIQQAPGSALAPPCGGHFVAVDLL